MLFQVTYVLHSVSDRLPLTCVILSPQVNLFHNDYDFTNYLFLEICNMLPLTIFKYFLKLVIMEIFCVFALLHLLMLEASFMQLKMELEWLQCHFSRQRLLSSLKSVKPRQLVCVILLITNNLLITISLIKVNIYKLV